MRFGIHIGHMGGPLDEMRKLWKFADTHGFDWFSVSDHFQESPPRGGDMDCYEAIATLTAAAMDTTKVRLGSGVYCVAYRNPGLLAKSLTTIDHLSNGRVDCGLGAGWHDVEAKAFGIPFPTIGPREDMLEEYAQIMRLLLDPEQKRASFQGKHFSVSNAPNYPKPLQPASRSGSAAAARSARCARRPSSPMDGTAPTSARRTGSTSARCSTGGARRSAATRGRSCAPSIWASISAPTPRAPRAARRSFAATSARAIAPIARATCAAPCATPTRWWTSSAPSAALGSASRSATGRTTVTPWRPSPARSCAGAEARYRRFRSRGSRLSRRPSPMMLTASTVAARKMLGNKMLCGNTRKSARPSAMMLPQVGVCGGIPTPRNDRIASITMAEAHT